MRSRENTDPLPPVAYWLLTARNRTGRSQEQIASAASIDTTYVGKIELGQKTPSKKVIVRLAAALLLPNASEAERRDVLNAGLQAGGFATPGTHSPIETIMYEKGYHADELSPEGEAQVLAAIEALIVGIVETERKKKNNP